MMYNNNVEYVTVKTILSKLRQPDPYFGITYNMNLYRGCQHGCIYCDTRSECYRVGDISKISIKQNSLELLNNELRLKRARKATIGTGSMNDPYMPIEGDLEITRNALKIILKEKFPVHVITKSDLITRDIDVLHDISDIYAAVSFTITTSDGNLSKKIEPWAPETSQRFKAMEQLAKNGIYTGITLMPLLPFINDTEENIKNILKRAKDAGASYVIPMFGVTLRKGSREYLYDSFDSIFPGMSDKYRAKFGDNYICNSERINALNKLFYEQIYKLDIKPRMRFFRVSEPEQLSLF